MKKLLAGLFALCSLSYVQALEVSLDINDAEIHANAIQPLSQGQNYFIVADGIYSEASNLSNTNNDPETLLLSGGFLLQQPLNDMFSFKFGAKVAAVLNDELEDLQIATPLGGEVTYVGQTQANIFYVKGFGYIAPDIISFGDMTNYLELGVQAEYPFTNQLRAYLGYRHVSAGLDEKQLGSDNITISSRPYVGVTFTF